MQRNVTNNIKFFNYINYFLNLYIDNEIFSYLNRKYILIIKLIFLLIIKFIKSYIYKYNFNNKM